MLMQLTYDVITTLDIKMKFDDDRCVKREKVSVGDIVNVTYNKNGLRRNIEGVVKEIVAGTSSKKTNTMFMIIDGSVCGISQVEKIDIENVLDITVLRKNDGLVVVHTPSNRMKVTDVRLNGDTLQISTNWGKTWLKVCQIKQDAYPVPEEYQELAAKIDSLLPAHMNPAVKTELIVELVKLFKDVNPEDIDLERIEKKLNETIEDVSENTSNIDYISRYYALADQDDEE